MSLNKGYTKLPNVLIFDEELSVPARLLYMQLLAAQFKHGETFSSRETMGKWLNDKKPRAVSNYIKELKNKDLIEVEEVPGKTNLYRAKEIKMDIKPKETPANGCKGTPAMKCNHKNKKRSLRIKDKEIYKESVNYPTAKALVEKYVTELPNLPKQRKKKTDICSAEKQLTIRLDRGEDIVRLELATVNAIKAQGNGYNPDWIIGPRNLFSTRPTGGKFAKYLPNETEKLYAEIFGEDNDN